MTTGKTIALTRRTFVGKAMSLLLNMLSRLVITFLPRNKSLFISWLQLPSVVILVTKVTQSCPTLCDPMDCSPPGSSVHGILQARVLEGVAISFSRGSSQPRDRTRVSCIPGRRFTLCAAREALGAPKNKVCHSLHCSSEYNPSDFGVNHLVTSMCRVFSCVVGRGCLL